MCIRSLARKRYQRRAPFALSQATSCRLAELLSHPINGRGGDKVAHMDEVTDQLKRTIERQYGGTATFVHSVPVHETSDGKTVWEGVVQVFDLSGQSKVKRPYAWSSKTDDGKKMFVAIPHMRPVTGTVRASQGAERRRDDSVFKSPPQVRPSRNPASGQLGHAT